MALENLILVTINATTTAIAHGLIHGGVSRTPHIVHIMQMNGTLSIGTIGWAMTFDSVTVTIQRGAPAQDTNLNFVAQMFVKRCHTVEDITGAF